MEAAWGLATAPRCRPSRADVAPQCAAGRRRHRYRHAVADDDKWAVERHARVSVAVAYIVPMHAGGMEEQGGSTQQSDLGLDAVALISFLARLARDLTRAGTTEEEARVRLVGDPLSVWSGNVRGLETARWVVPEGDDPTAALEIRDESGRLIARLIAPRAARHAWTYLVAQR